MTVADFYSAKHSMLHLMLQAALDSGCKTPFVMPESLDRILEDLYDSFGDTLDVFPHDDPSAEDDPSRDACESWYSAHAEMEPELQPEPSVMSPSARWLCALAYVFWDRDRVQKQFRGGFGATPDTRTPEDNRGYQLIQESFDERSAIWRKGGTGYWSRNDTSRIVWSVRPPKTAATTS
ncbi:hypothetical protein N658DRAFT_292882 [Parathielavia hyrcaniae]|uniref:Uncharacterized protein n=1 Tax=Parathielavia hyrcaniae TaxID=113614 RepID=A0AAN6PVD2_9PEZI|nr:hypothetical protein N658DRAFT_292882 [Parathielavia hyrcaniae]